MLEKLKNILESKNTKLLEWQNILLDKPCERLITSEKELIKMSDLTIKNRIKIADDCSKLLQKTTKPDVFFERLSLFENTMEYLSRLEPYVAFKDVKPSVALNAIKKEKQEIIREFLIRYFSAVFDKIENLKTAKSKINNLQNFYDSLEKYKSEMNEDNIDYYTTKYNVYTRDYSKEHNKG